MGKLKNLLIDLDNEQIYVNLDEGVSDLKAEILKEAKENGE